MRTWSQGWRILVAILLLGLSLPHSQAYLKNEKSIKSAVFLSPKFVMGPGSVENKYYFDIDFPRGHVALKSFDAEVVDEAGNPVPLLETYLHHWFVMRYYARKDSEVSESDGSRIVHKSDYITVRNAGVCHNLFQYFGLGSETRGTKTHIPDPYGIEIGNPDEIPAGYEEGWMLNIHAIDTRGVEDRLGCTECRCDVYNVTVDEYGNPLRPDYKGGLLCCYDHTQCQLKHGFESARRSLYMKYTVKWVDWDTSVVPVKIFEFDVTDTEKKINNSTGLSIEHHCLVEYEVEPCKATSMADDACSHTQRTSVTMPTDGYMIYGVAHQHSGGQGLALYREDGEVICASIPAYGNGTEAGNEAGYIVGMSTCYPEPGSIKLTAGETLIVESNYSSSLHHTGVMGLFYFLLADRVPEPYSFFDVLTNNHRHMKHSAYSWAAVVLLGAVVVVVVAAVWYHRRKENVYGYQPVRV
ncbi:Stress up-regulated Nod 19 [Melia azedarach]|uniref:Stress up-regulated Nod 19 n=1 Tax=Melia azedarach TaxID=155640 RepID=A0ACC1Z0B3_MELAZ|nr:Stress up-regulated Nod 19 [Melia azedarach]